LALVQKQRARAKLLELAVEADAVKDEFTNL